MRGGEKRRGRGGELLSGEVCLGFEGVCGSVSFRRRRKMTGDYLSAVVDLTG